MSNATPPVWPDTRPDARTGGPAYQRAAQPSPLRDSGVAGRIRRHPLISFFVLAYAISWVLWLPYVLSVDGTGLLNFRFPSLLMGQNELTGILPGAYAGPLGSALIVTAVAGGADGLRAWRRRLFQWRVRWYWYVIVLAGIPFLLVSGALGLPGMDDNSITAPSMTVLAMYLPMLLIQVVSTGAAEEPGWRDFALPVLQRRHGPLLGTLILSVVWAFWHLPLFLTSWSLGGTDPSTAHWWQTIGIFLLMCIGISYLITFVFNHTKQSLPLALLLHASNNTVASVVLPAMFTHVDGSSMLAGGAIGYGITAIVLLVVTRGRLGYRPEEVHDRLGSATR